MRFKRINRLKKHFLYYKKRELKKIQFFSLITLYIALNFDTNFLKKIYDEQIFIRNNNLRFYCIFSGRSRGICKKLYVSRIQLRDLNFSRIFLGLRKIN